MNDRLSIHNTPSRETWFQCLSHRIFRMIRNASTFLASPCEAGNINSHKLYFRISHNTFYHWFLHFTGLFITRGLVPLEMNLTLVHGIVFVGQKRTFHVVSVSISFVSFTAHKASLSTGQAVRILHGSFLLRTKSLTVWPSGTFPVENPGVPRTSSAFRISLPHFSIWVGHMLQWHYSIPLAWRHRLVRHRIMPSSLMLTRKETPENLAKLYSIPILKL
jgi:hypothetical protein